jgi:hypothetical protein
MRRETVMQLGSSIADFNYYAKNQARLLASYPKQDPTVQRNAAYATANLPKVTSVQDLVGNYRLLSVVLGAFGLSGAINQKALVKQLLSQDPTAKGSLAQRMLDPRFTAMAKALSTLRYDGGAVLRDPKSVASIVNAYVQDAWQTSIGNDNMSVRQALYFQKNIGSVTSLYGILGDHTLAAVVRGALELPDQFSALDPKQQMQVLQQKGFDLSKFKDPNYATKFVDKFLALADINAGGYAGTSNPVSSLTASLLSPPSDQPVSIDVSGLLQNGLNIVV